MEARREYAPGRYSQRLRPSRPRERSMRGRGARAEIQRVDRRRRAVYDQTRISSIVTEYSPLCSRDAGLALRQGGPSASRAHSARATPNTPGPTSSISARPARFARGRRPPRKCCSRRVRMVERVVQEPFCLRVVEEGER